VHITSMSITATCLRHCERLAPTSLEAYMGGVPIRDVRYLAVRSAALGTTSPVRIKEPESEPLRNKSVA
jgi:hypothetical protein